MTIVGKGQSFPVDSLKQVASPHTDLRVELQNIRDINNITTQKLPHLFYNVLQYKTKGSRFHWRHR